MENSFPLTEFRTKEEQKNLFQNKYYNILGIKEGGSLVAFAAIWRFDKFTFIEHLATLPQRRNDGLGSRILCEIIKSAQNQVCLEVEPPNDELTKRRIAFYERNGMFFNSHPYIQPSISKGRKAIPLFIMTSQSTISKESFENIKNTLYKEVYKV
jgi:ribosomal protein S18 acetylase RimI-like enzyme